MATRGRSTTRPRATYRAGLTRDRVFRTAVTLADEGGIAALTMRNLAQELGVEAMSLYHHVADKDEVLDGMVDVVVSEINARVAELDAPPGGADSAWKTAVRQRILTAREVLLGHPWAPGVMQPRPGIHPGAVRPAERRRPRYGCGGDHARAAGRRIPRHHRDRGHRVWQPRQGLHAGLVRRPG